MSRYIDADVLKEKLPHDVDLFMQVIGARHCIDETPTADVAEVKHGEWLATDKFMVDKCSECGAEIDWEALYNYDFDPDEIKCCYHCGAKMYGKEAEQALKECNSNG